MKIRLTNTTDIPVNVVRRVLRFTCPENVAADISVRLTNSRRGYRGCYYPGRRHVLLRVGRMFPRVLQPYQYAQHKGRKYVLADRLEALVYLAAHELRHHWQAWGKHRNSSFPHGYAPRARGRFSEVDTEAYAIRTLRRWRTQAVISQSAK